EVEVVWGQTFDGCRPSPCPHTRLTEIPASQGDELVALTGGGDFPPAIGETDRPKQSVTSVFAANRPRRCPTPTRYIGAGGKHRLEPTCKRIHEHGLFEAEVGDPLG